MTRSVPEMLRECAATYEKRGAIYGHSYHQFGHLMMAMFPGGMVVDSVDAWNRIGVLVQIGTKLIRYGNQFEQGGHDDSLLDQSVYAQMLRELDNGIRERALPAAPVDTGTAHAAENGAAHANADI